MQGIDKELAKYVAHLHENGYLLHQPLIAAQAVHNGWIVITVDSGWDATYDVTATGEIAFGIQDTATPQADAAGDARPQTLEDHILYALEDGEQSIVQIYNHVLHIAGVEINRLTLERKLGEMLINKQIAIEVRDGNRMYHKLLPVAPVGAGAGDSGGYVVLEGGSPLDGYSVVREENEGVVIVADISNRTNAYDVARALINETSALRTQLTEAQATITRLQSELAAARDISAASGKIIASAAHYLGQSDSKDKDSNRAYDILQGYADPD